MAIVKNDGTWTSKPSGLKQGNLKAWKKMIHDACPKPEIDDIVIDQTTEGEIIGYLCTIPKGYDSYWKRVAKPLELQQQAHPRDQLFLGSAPRQSTSKSKLYYTKRFAEVSQISEPDTKKSMDFDDHIR